MGIQNLTFLSTMKYTILFLMAMIALSQCAERRLGKANTKDYQLGSSNKKGWKCSNTKYDKNFVCQKSCTRASGCRANNDFSRARDTFETKVKGGKLCVRRTDGNAAGKGWGMKLKVRCGKQKIVRIGNKRGKGKRCAKIAKGYNCPKTCTKDNGCRANMTSRMPQMLSNWKSAEERFSPP